MPVHNGGSFLKAAVQSVLDQSYSDFELLIINDGSTDDSEQTIKSFTDQRIVYIGNQTNLGLVATLNKGLELCRGNYIARMDADDLCLPKRFEKQVAFLENNPNVAVLSTRLKMINEKGEDLGYWNDDFETTRPEEIARTMPKLNCIGHPTIMMRAEVVKKVKYEEKFLQAEDWGLWLKLLAQGETIAKLDEVLLLYRVHASGAVVSSNRNGIGRRIIRFKRNYLLNRLSGFKFGAVDRRVARYFLIDILKYRLPLLYKFIIKYIESDFARMREQRREFKKVFNNLNAETKTVFLFPFCHLGGAEVVHASIVRAAAFTRPVVLFTSRSGSPVLLPSFMHYATVLHIDQLTIWPRSKRKVIAALQEAGQRNKLSFFSSNSRFYYEFLASCTVPVRAIDLIHAFMHTHEDSAEKWSLPVVPKLAKRVVINGKTRRDFKAQYEENNVDPGLLERIVYISNYAEKAAMPLRDYNGTINILYVGRGTAEKRVGLLARIAWLLKEEGLPVQFYFAGDVKDAIPVEYLSACTLYGEVKEAEKLAEIYNTSHLLAMASTREGFPMVIMEAMMHGAVPVTSNVGGIPEHVHNWQSGILIDAIEPAAFESEFIDAIRNIVKNRRMLETMSQNAHEYALANFGKEKFESSYKSLFSNGL